MATTRVFLSGNSRAVRIPRDIHLPVGEVEIHERGEELVIRRRRDTLAAIPDLLASLPKDFLADGCSDTPPRRRRGL